MKLSNCNFPLAHQETLTKLSAELQEAITLLREHTSFNENSEQRPVASKDSALLEQCFKLLSAQNDLVVDPIRTVHHFACTGGTLFSKCIASMPNVQLLSEVNPFSQSTAASQSGAFVPTDMINLLRQSSRGEDDAMIAEIFRAEIKAVYKNCINKGLRLVLRDHSHSHYCVGNNISIYPTLHQLLAGDHELRSIVTVRHPMESWVSLGKNNWISWQPATISEYAERYLKFLDAHRELPIFRYEDFVLDPKNVMNRICLALELPFNEEFGGLFQIFKLSGDSGRSGTRIEPRSKRLPDDNIKEQARASVSYQELCERLGYGDLN